MVVNLCDLIRLISVDTKVGFILIVNRNESRN